MSQTTTDRVKAIKNTPGTGEFVQVSEINDAFDKLDNHFVPAAKMVNSVAQSIPNNAITTATYNTTLFDTYAGRGEGPMANNSTETITIRKSGLYLVTANNSFAVNATGVRRADIRKNGTSILSIVNGAFTGGATTLCLSDIFDLDANDTITCVVFQTSGAALDCDGNTFAEGKSLSAVWVGSPVEV